MQLNENVRSLPNSYVFEELAKRRVSIEKKRGEKLIDLGIGDIKLPLFGCVSEAMKEAAEKVETVCKQKGVSKESMDMILREVFNIQ